jgi:hypothetical protein
VHRAPEAGDRHAGRAALVAALALLAGSIALAACGDDDGGSSGADGPDTSRIAQARVYQNHRMTLTNQTPESIGDALAKLEPTWVTGVIRLEKKKTPPEEAVSGYRTIRETVQKEAPDAQFDVELNALDYGTPEEVESKMAELRETFDPDGWFFDFFTPAYAKRPEVVDAAIADAHEHGEWVGGNAFGWVRNPTKLGIPDDADYIAVSDSNFRLDRSAVRKLAKRLPVVFHLANSPGNIRKEGCVYIKRYSTKKRVAYLKRRASEQSGSKFHFAYPVFFPTCRPGITALDTLREGSMFQDIEGLMRKYN